MILSELIERKALEMGFGTCASVCIIHVLCDLLIVKPFLKTDMKLRTYSRHKIRIDEEAKFQVSDGSQRAWLPIIVTASLVIHS